MIEWLTNNFMELVAILTAIFLPLYLDNKAHSEKFKVNFSCKIEETQKKNCLENEFIPHDHHASYKVEIFNTGTKAIHIRSITGTGLTDKQRKIRVNFYGDITAFPEDDDINDIVTTIPSTQEELDHYFDDGVLLIQPNTSPFIHEWTQHIQGINSIPTTAEIEIKNRKENGKNKTTQS